MATPPSAPIIRNAPDALPNTLEFCWFPPANLGSPATITGYRLTLQPGNLVYTLPGNFNEFVVTGLTNGLTYQTTIEATNNNGSTYGPPASFREFQPGSPPQAPPVTAVATTYSTDGAVISWTAPTVLPDAQIFWYVVTAISSNASDTIISTNGYALMQSNLILTGLNSNSQYYFNVRPVNCPGYGPILSTNAISWIAPITLFAPTQLTGMQLWLDGADSTKLYTDTAFTTNVATNGQSVAGWVDKSSNALRFVQLSAGSRPTYTTSGLGSNSVVTFNTSFLNSISTFGLYTSSNSGAAFFSVFLTTANEGQKFLMTYQNQVFDTLGVTETEIGYDTGNNTGVGNFGFHKGSSSATIAPANTIANNTATLMASVLDGSSATPNNITIYKNGTGTSIQQDNAGFYSGTTYPAGNSNRSTIIGARGEMKTATPVNSFHAGYIGDLLWFNTAITSFDRQKVEGYLAWKWGLQNNLPTSHPFRASRPLSNSVFAPTSFSGLRLWIDAQDATKVTLGSGSTITTLTDKSSNGFIFSNVSGYGYTPSSFNTIYPSFTAPGVSGNTLGSNESFTLTNPMTVFFVGKNDKATNNYSFIYNTPTNTNATFVNNNDRYSMFAGTQVDNLSITGTNQSNIVISAVYNGASSAFVQNGSTIVTGFNPGTNGITGGLVLGQWYIQDNKAWGGKYCELLMFSNVLSTEDRQTTEGYLAWKWGLQGSLPTTHPYKFQSPASNYSSAVVPQGLLINFDAPTYSGSGQWINRGALGTSFNATITAGQTPTKNVAGNGIVFNGSSGWTFANIGQQTSFTISSWIKRTAVIPDYVALVSDGIDSGTQINMALMGSHPTIPITNTDVQGGFYDGTWRTGPSVTLTSNTWVHVTATFDTTTKNLITYANGVRTNTTQFSGLTPNTGGRLYRIGQHITNVPLYFTGEIGQVLIYNRALTSTEVTQNYAVTSTIYTNPAPPSLVTSGLLIRFDATTYSGSGTWSNAGSLGTGYNASVLSGSPSKNTAGNGVVITNNLEYRFTAPSLQTTWTMSSWFKRTGTCPGDCAIVCEVFANNTINMCLGANGLSANTFAGGFYSGRWYNSPTATPSLNAWTHLCVTYNGTTMTLYINGTASSSNTPGGTIGTANSGQYRINVSGVQSLVGEIGQILIYGRALTASEVAQNYAATNTAFIA